MFFLLNAIWIALLIVSGVFFSQGKLPLAILFLVLGVLELGVVYVIYRKRRTSSSGLDCFALEVVGEVIPDCIDCGHFDCTP